MDDSSPTHEPVSGRLGDERPNPDAWMSTRSRVEVTGFADGSGRCSLSPKVAEAEDIRAKYSAVAEAETTYVQFRFQTLALYLAAVGFIVGLGHQSARVGALLMLVSGGLWVLDLRNRDMIALFLTLGAEIEEQMTGESGFFIPRRPDGRGHSVTRFGLLNQRTTVSGGVATLIHYQVGIDFVFFSVMGYGLTLLVGAASPWVVALLMIAPLATAALGATAISRRSPRNPEPGRTSRMLGDERAESSHT